MISERNNPGYLSITKEKKARGILDGITFDTISLGNWTSTL
jgi:hypothetical protein